MMDTLMHHGPGFVLTKLAAGSSLLLLVALAIARWHQQRTAAMRCLALQCGLAGVLLLPLAFLLPGRPATTRTATAETPSRSRTPIAGVRTSSVKSDETPSQDTKPEPSGATHNFSPQEPAGDPSRRLKAELGAMTATSAADPFASPEVSFGQHLLNAITVIWLVVFAARLAAIAISFLRANILASSGRPADLDGVVADIGDQLGAQNDCISVWYTDVPVPLTTGAFRHRILLPHSAREWTEDRVRMVLAHEMAHIRRRDVAMRLLCQFACALAWFNPLAWLAYRRAERDREMACDDEVLLLGSSAADYAECLIGVGQFSAMRRLAAVSIADPPLLTRLRAILDGKAPRGSTSRGGRMRMLAVVVAIVLLCGLLHPTTARTLAQKSKEQVNGVRTDKLGDPLEEHVLHRFGTRRFQHPDSVLELCLSKDERTVITYGRDLVIGWDANSGKQLWTKRREGLARRSPRFGTGYGIRVLAKAAGTGEVVSLRTNEHLPIWNARTGDVTELELDGADHEAKAIDISPDGRFIALGGPSNLQVFSRDGRTLFDVANNPTEDIEELVDPRGRGSDRLGFPGEFSYARFAPSGKQLALVNSEKPTTFRLVDTDTWTSIREIKTSKRVVRFVFSPDSKTIAATERDSSVRLYDVQSGKRIWEKTFPAAVNAESYTSAVDFHPNGAEIAVGAVLGPDRTVRILDATSGKETAELAYPGWRPWTLHYSSDGKTLLSSGWDGTVHRWVTATRELLPLPGGLRASSICSIAGKGGLLAYQDSTDTIHVASQETGDTVRKLKLKGISWSSLRFNPSGSLLAAAGVDKKQIHLILWNVADGTKKHHWSWDKGRDPHSSAYSISFSGNQVAANVFRQSRAYVWDLTTGKRLTSIQHPSVFGASLNNGKLVTVGWNRQIKEWDATTGKELRSLTTGKVSPDGRIGPNGDTRIYSVRVSDDRSLMATCDMTSSIRLYDRDWNQLVVIPRAGGSQRPLALSRNGLWVSYAYSQLNVFDVASGDAVFQATAHQQGIDTIEFGPKDRTILTGADDGICNLWQFPSHTSELADDKLFANLIGTNGKLAFASFRQLDSDPERAVKLLESRLGPFATDDVAVAEVRKQIVALGSGKERIVERAKAKLFEFGPGVVPMLRAELDSDQLSNAKKSEVIKLAFNIHRRYRRASMLLAQLDSKEADAVLKQLTRKSKEKHSGPFFEEAMRYRDGLR